MRILQSNSKTRMNFNMKTQGCSLKSSMQRLIILQASRVGFARLQKWANSRTVRNKWNASWTRIDSRSTLTYLRRATSCTQPPWWCLISRPSSDENKTIARTHCAGLRLRKRHDRRWSKIKSRKNRKKRSNTRRNMCSRHWQTKRLSKFASFFKRTSPWKWLYSNSKRSVLKKPRFLQLITLEETLKKAFSMTFYRLAAKLYSKQSKRLIQTRSELSLNQSMLTIILKRKARLSHSRVLPRTESALSQLRQSCRCLGVRWWNCQLTKLHTATRWATDFIFWRALASRKSHWTNWGLKSQKPTVTVSTAMGL